MSSERTRLMAQQRLGVEPAGVMRQVGSAEALRHGMMPGVGRKPADVPIRE